MWRRRRSGDNRVPKAFDDYVQAIIEQDGIEPLRPGELRPPEYYLVGKFTRGRKPIDMAKYYERHKNDEH